MILRLLFSVLRLLTRQEQLANGTDFVRILKAFLWGGVGVVASFAMAILHAFLLGEMGRMTLNLFSLALPVIFFVGSLKSSEEKPFKTFVCASGWAYLAFAVGTLVSFCLFHLLFGGSLLGEMLTELAGVAIGVAAFVSSLKDEGKPPSWLYQKRKKKSKSFENDQKAA